MPKKLSVRVKLISAMLSIALVSLMSVGFIALMNLKENSHKNAVERLTSITHLQKKRIQSFVLHYQERLQLIAEMPQLKVSLAEYLKYSKPDEQQKLIEIISASQNSIDGFSLIQIADHKGSILASTVAANIGLQDKHALHQNKTHQVNSFMIQLDLSADNSLYAVLKQPIFLEKEYLGYLDIHASVDELKKIVNDYTGMGKTGETILAKKLNNGDAQFLTSLRFDPNKSLKRIIKANRIDVPIIRALGRDTGFHQNIVDYREVPVLAVTEFIHETGWGILNKMDVSEVYENYDYYKSVFVSLIFIIILITSIVSIWIAYSITNPIKKLTALVTSKKFSELSEISSYANDSETRELGLSMGAMYQELGDQQKLLLKAKDNAEIANLEKSRFLANMSHELRTPMHSILSFSSLALKKVDETEKVTRFLKNIRASGLRLTTLLDDLLDLAKLESGKMQVQFVEEDVTVLIDYALAEVDGLLTDKRMTVNYDNSESFECCLDKKLIMQVMINILSNAIKFSPDKSELHIDVKNDLLTSENTTIPAIKISITDEGIGIPEEELDMIFDKFVQSSKTKSQSGGTGLGLPITKEIVELHSGKIWAESPPQNGIKGTSIRLMLPLKQVRQNDFEIQNVQDAIDAHLEWTRMINHLYDTGEGLKELSKSMIANESLCALGQWINQNGSTDPLLLDLQKVHKEFHFIAGEYLAFIQLGSQDKASDLHNDFQAASIKVIQLLEELKRKATV